jgi:hypothetical protein
MALCIIDRQIDRQTDRQTDGRTDGRTDEWMDGWMDGQTDRKIVLRKHMYILLIVSFRRQNIIIDVTNINNLQYNFVIIKCNCKTKDLG